MINRKISSNFRFSLKWSIIFTARNEVGARLCFYRCVWFCSQGGVGTPPQTWYTPRDQVHTPPGPDTPPGTRYTPHTRHTRQDQVHPPTRCPTSPWTRYPPWDQLQPPPPGHVLPQHAGRYGLRAGGTHPTGMQYCNSIIPHKIYKRYMCNIITARKWSLWRLCFYTRLSFCQQGGGRSRGMPGPRGLPAPGRGGAWWRHPPGRLLLHPTGMHSCLVNVQNQKIKNCFWDVLWKW